MPAMTAQCLGLSCVLGGFWWKHYLCLQHLISLFLILLVDSCMFRDESLIRFIWIAGGVVDTYASFVWEPALVKINALTAATEAACLVLSVDETVRNPKSEGPDGQGGPGRGMPGRGRGRGRGRGMRR